ncbi:MAG: enoyl-CoA hydratase/isomerase family protein [Rubrivivax sp.]
MADRVATLLLCRPDSRNALNVQMCKELVAACDLLRNDPDVRVVVVRGAGAVFCAGADLKERQGMSMQEMIARRVDGFTAYGALEACPKATIAVVHGAAFGAGCEIAAACDFIVASESGCFKYPELGWGTVGATQRLPRMVGRRAAKELLYTGRTFSAREAHELGLVTRLVADEALEGTLTELTHTISKANPLTLALTKRSIDQGLDTTREGAMAVELLAIQENLRSSDWQGAIADFGKD